MSHPNFLPHEIKNQLRNISSDETNFRALFSVRKRLLSEKVVLTAVFILAMLIAWFGFPVADGIYRAYKLYPIAKAVQQDIQNSDVKNLYAHSAEGYHHLERLSSDANKLAALDFVPVLGPKLESLNYTVAGLTKTTKVFLPPLKTLASSDNQKFSEITAAERKEFINHLAAHSGELKEAANLLEKGGLDFGPKRLETVLTFLDKTAYLSSELPQILGVDKPARYLVIFANNLEIRPGGGFVGSYALVTVKDGEIAEFAARDSYELPGAFNLDLGPPAPAVVQRYLGIRGIPFRDSNWSPDYPTSAQTLRQAYAREGGEYNHDIQGVITISTEVLKEVVAVTGPVKVGDILFTKDNVVEELEKQVEISFWQEGIPWLRRKDIVGDLAQILRQRIDNFGITEGKELLSRFGSLADSRHIVFNFDNQKLQSLVSEYGWDGTMSAYEQDTLMIVDANLAGFKTEPAMVKNYKYTITEKDGKLIANLNIHYRHRGRLNPLVHNYRTYLRVYAPAGSRLIFGDADVSQELNRTVFGSLVVVPVGEQRNINLTYELPATVSADNNYSLQVLKQIGAYANDLLLNFDFGNVKEEIKGEKLDTNKLYQFN